MLSFTSLNMTFLCESIFRLYSAILSLIFNGDKNLVSDLTGVRFVESLILSIFCMLISLYLLKSISFFDGVGINSCDSLFNLVPIKTD